MRTKRISSLLVALAMILSLMIVPQSASAATKILYEASNISGAKAVNLDDIGFVSGGKYQIEATVVPTATSGWHWAYIDVENSSFSVHDWNLATYIDGGYYFNGSWKSSVSSNVMTPALSEGIKFTMIWDTASGVAKVTSGNSGWTFAEQTWNPGVLPESGKFGSFKVGGSGATVKSISVSAVDYESDAMYEAANIIGNKSVNLDSIGFVSGGKYQIEATVVPTATTGWHWAYIDIDGSSFSVHDWNLATFINDGYYINGSWKSSVSSNVMTPALSEGINFTMVWDTASGVAKITAGNSGWTFAEQTWNPGVLPEGGTFGKFVIGGSGATVKSIGIYECLDITATAEEGGKVSGSGAYTKGDSVTLTATPDLGYEFAGWYDGEVLVSSESVYTFKATESKAYTAKFEIDVTEYDTTILACADFQNTDGSEAGAAVVSGIIDAIEGYGFKDADSFFACGDYAQTYGETEANLEVLKDAVIDFVPEEDNHIYVQGNHDAAIGTQGLAESGNNDTEDYGVFVINEDDYMWYNSDKERIKATAKNLADYINAKLAEDYEKPIFILSHLPLYKSLRTTEDGDAQHANQLFYVLNQAGAQGLNIIFMSGHDHSNGFDSYLGGSSVYLAKGDSINIPQGNKTDFKAETLNFTYMNAGYVGYYAAASGRDSDLTMTYFGINGDTVDIYRFDSEGLHNLKSAGVLRSAEAAAGEYEADTRIYTSPQTITLSDVNYISDIKTMVDVSVKVTGGLGKATGASSYEPGSTATLTAVPDEGYGFVGWYDGDTLLSQESTYSFVVEENKNLTLKLNKTSEEVSYEATNISGTKRINLDDIGFVSGGKYQIEATVVPSAVTGWHWAYVDLDNSSFQVHDWNLATFIHNGSSNGYYVNGSYKSSASENVTTPALTEGIKFNIIWDTKAGTAKITAGNSGWTFAEQTWNAGVLPEGGKFGELVIGGKEATIKSISIKDYVDRGVEYEVSDVSGTKSVNLDDIGFADGGKYKINATVIPKEATGWPWAYMTVENSSFSVHGWGLASFINDGYYFNGSWKSAVGSNVTTPALTEGINFEMLWDTEKGTATITAGNSGWTFPTQTWNSGVLPEGGTFGKLVVGGVNCTVKSLTIKECAEVAVSDVENGTVNGDGMYVLGDKVTLKAVPDAEYVFAGWYEEGEKVSGNEEFTFRADGNKTYTVKFVKYIVLDSFEYENKDNVITATVSCPKYDEASLEDAVIIIAQYDNSGKLLSATISDAGVTSTVKTFTTEADNNCASVKAMFWMDSTGSMPLSGAAVTK